MVIVTCFSWWLLQHCTGFARLLWGTFRLHRAFIDYIVIVIWRWVTVVYMTIHMWDSSVSCALSVIYMTIHIHEYMSISIHAYIHTYTYWLYPGSAAACSHGGYQGVRLDVSRCKTRGIKVYHYIFMSIYIDIYKCIHTYIHVWIVPCSALALCCLCACSCVCVCAHVFTCVCVRVCVHVSVCVRACICSVWMHIWMQETVIQCVAVVQVLDAVCCRWCSVLP